MCNTHDLFSDFVPLSDMTASIYEWLKRIAINVLVVTCDLKRLPNVEDANAVIKPETGELMLPGNFSVTYACNEWYSLMSSSDKVRCEYNMQPREGSPADDDDAQLVTAVWRGHEDIRCEKGI